MPPAEMPNPFHTHKADDTIRLPPGDVPDLHSHARQRCLEALAQARRTGTSAGLLVVGEAGGGKSHLIASLRAEIAADPTAALAAIRLGKAYSGRLWRHLRERLAEELLLPYTAWGGEGCGLLRLLRNRFPQWDGGDLTPHLAECESIDYSLARVLPRLTGPKRTRFAADWLRGKQLSPRDLEHLDLPPVIFGEQEQEAQAQDVALSLLRLAGDRTALLICFDEVEAIQAGAWDAAALRQFATLATGLLAEPGPRAVVTFVRPRLLDEMRKVVEASNVQKISQVSTTLFPLDLEDARRVVSARLDAEPTLHEARRTLPGEPLWPLGETFVAATVKKSARTMTARELVTACRAEFDRVQGKGAPPARPLTAADFARAWLRLRKKHLGAPAEVPFDSVLGLGLPWLLRLADLPLDPVTAKGDLELMFQPRQKGERPVGVSFCNHGSKSLWRRLDRLLERWREGDLGALVVLRGEAEWTPEGSVKRLDELRSVGARVVLLDGQQLAELAAFQEMMTKSLEGKLLHHGAAVEPAAFDAWARAHLSDSVKELFQVAFEPEPATAG